MLIVCFKNHALDQFLEDLLDIGIPADHMVRLGGQCTPRTKCMQLYDQPSARSNIPYKALNELREKLETLAAQMDVSFQEYQSMKLRHADLMEYLEFSPQGAEYYEAFSVPQMEDGATMVGHKGKGIKESYLLDRWTAGKDAGIFHGTVSETSQRVWQIPGRARQNLLSAWKEEILGEKVCAFQAIAEDYNKSLIELERLRKGKHAQVIASKRIVACTTT